MTSTAEIELLRRTSPALAKQHLCDVFRQAKGSRTEAARVLGVSERSLYRMIKSLDMWAEIDVIAEECGYGRKGKRT